MSSTTPSREPIARFDYSPESCLPHLRKLLDEFRDHHPDWHTFIVHNYTIHLGTGKKVIGTEDDLSAAEAASAAPAGLATPRRRTAPRTAESPANLNRAQDKIYMSAPLLAAKTDKDIAAFIVRSCSSSAGRSQLRTAAGDSGRAALLHIEARGKGAAGSPLQIAASLALDQLQAAGPAAFSSDAWHSFSEDLQSQAIAAGVVDPAAVAGRVRAGVFHFPEAHASAAYAASASATTPAAVTQAVDDYIQGIIAGQRIASYRTAPQPPPPPPLAVDHRLNSGSHDGSDRAVLAARRQAPPPGQHWTGPARGNDPPMHTARMPGVDYSAEAAPLRRSLAGQPWIAATHGPCLNWTRGRQGCDGRHHLPDCPLPRPTLAVEHAPEDPEPAPPPIATLTTIAATSDATRDFAALFASPGPVEMQLSPHPVLTATMAHQDLFDAAMDLCDGCTPQTYDDLLVKAHDSGTCASSWSWTDVISV